MSLISFVCTQSHSFKYCYVTITISRKSFVCIYSLKVISFGNEGILCTPQSSSITRASPSNCLMSYPEHSLPSAKMQSLYSTAPPPADWADKSCIGHLFSFLGGIRIIFFKLITFLFLAVGK